MVQDFTIRALLVGVILGLASRGAWADDAAAPEAPSLAAMAREAARNFKPVAPAELEQARGRLSGALARLDRFLARGGRAKVEGWKRYLEWEALVRATQSGSAADAQELQRLAGKLRAAHQGLELSHFTDVRDALESYAAVAGTAVDDKLQSAYEKQVNDLATQLDAYAKDSANGDAALAIGAAIGWLQAHHQASDLVAAVRQTYGHTNLDGYVSRRLLASRIESHIDRVQGVHENILGTSIHGTARLIGNTRVTLDENQHVASLRIMLGGSIYSNNVGYHGPVTIHSSANTSVSAQKHVTMSAEGLVGYCAGAVCCTSSTIHDICARCGLVERIAWKRAGKQKGQAEAIASQKASTRIAGQMDREGERLLAPPRDRYQEKIREPLLRRGEFPQELAFSSHPDRGMVRMRKEGAGLIAAPTDPPAMATDHDMALRAHESVVINFAQGLMGGYELTDLRLEKLIKDDLEAELPEELRVTLPDGTIDKEKEPWSITFAKELPVRARFHGDRLSLAIRADTFKRGEGDTPDSYKPAITELVEIAADYTINRTPAGATLRRDGDVKIRFPKRQNPDQIPALDSPTVTFMRRKFRNLFKEEFKGEGIQLQGKWAAAGTLKLREIKADQAWLSVAWQMAEMAPGQQPSAAAAGGE